MCVCLVTNFGFVPPFLAGFCGVCGLAWVLACTPPFLAGVLGPVFVRALPLYHATPWLWFAMWVCVLGLGVQLRPAAPGWGVEVCVCLCARFACTPPLLAGVCGVGVCAWAGGSAAPRHSWLGCWGVCVCFCARSACTPPLLAGVCGVGVCAWALVLAAPRHSLQGCWGVCVFVCTLHRYPATPGWGARCGSVSLGWGFGFTPLLLAGVLGCNCVGVRAPLASCHSWLGCAVWVCVLGLGFRLRPATPGRVVGVCVCLCACSACTPPLLAGVCSVGVCAWARNSTAPRHSVLGCCGVCGLQKAL